MISDDSVEAFTKAFVDYLQRHRWRNQDWKNTPASHRRVYIDAAREGFREIGVGVEGGEDADEKKARPEPGSPISK